MTKTVTRKELNRLVHQLDARKDDIYTLLLEPVIDSFREVNKEQIDEIDKFIHDKNHEYFVHEIKDGIEVVKTRMVHKLSSIKDKVKPAPVREIVMQPGKDRAVYTRECEEFLNTEIEITL